MIVGLGVDLASVERIEAAFTAHGDRFEQRIFTAAESLYCRAQRRPGIAFAARFAAKEAFAKAVGTGFRRGVFMRDIGVVNLASGEPTLRLTGGAKARLDAMIPPGHAARIHLTMTDDHPFALAVVLITALPEEPET